MQDPQLDKSSFYDAQWKKWNDMIHYSPAPRFRREKIISWLKKLPVKTLLDVGCGNGEFLLQVHRALPDKRLTGADVAADRIAENRSAMPEFRFAVLDVNAGALTERFDAVVCMEVIEHCDDYRSAIRNLAVMTNKWLLITVPCGPLFEIDRRVGHTRHFSTNELSAVLEDTGMKVIKLQQWGFPFFNMYKHAINFAPDRMSQTFLSDRRYTWKEKFLALATYAAFRVSLPWWGYQAFVLASK